MIQISRTQMLRSDQAILKTAQKTAKYKVMLE